MIRLGANIEHVVLFSHKRADLLLEAFVDGLPNDFKQVGEQQQLQEDCELHPKDESDAAMLRQWRVVRPVA